MNEKIGMQDLVVFLAEKANIAKKDAETLVKECFEIMAEGLIKDKLLKVRNLGTFKLVRVEDRESVDVSTGERVLIPAHYKISFTPDIELAEKVNAPYASLKNVEIEEETITDETTDEVENIDETDDETENDDETEENLIATDYSQEETEKQEEPEIKELENEELADSEQYNEDYRPAKAKNRFLWIFCLVASIIILFLAGRYFCPVICSKLGWGVTPDSVVVFSYSVNKPLASDSLTEQEPDTPAAQTPISPITQPATTPQTQPTTAPKAKTFVNKQHRVRNRERLNTIALREYGHKAFWVYIYDENRNKISNPDLIEPGMVINIPPAEKYGINKNNRESVEKALRLEQQYKKR